MDNGQHVLFGCYRETFAFLRAIDAYRNVALDERLDIEVIDGDFVRSRLVTPQWAPPLHLVGGLLRWSALGLRDRAAALRMGLALRRLSRLDDGDSWARLSAKTAETWLIECGQTPRLRELLWEPLVVAALNQSPATAAAAPFARVLTRMFNGTRSDAAIGLPRVPLDALYAEPARRWLEAQGRRFARAPPRLLWSKADALPASIFATNASRPARSCRPCPGSRFRRWCRASRISRRLRTTRAGWPLRRL